MYFNFKKHIFSHTQSARAIFLNSWILQFIPVKCRSLDSKRSRNLGLTIMIRSSSGVFFDLRKSAILNFWPTPNKLACPSLGGRGLSFSPKFRNFVSYNGQPLSNLPPPYFIYTSFSFLKTPILKGWPKCLQLNKKFSYFLTGFV